MSENSEMKKSSVSIILGFWTGAVIWTIFMFAFGWWNTWWAYIPFLGTIYGSIQKTADYLHNRKLTITQGVNNKILDQTTTQTSISTNIGNLNDKQHNQDICPGCGEKLESSNLKFCSACGYHLN